jgi:hypothetical protein
MHFLYFSVNFFSLYYEDLNTSAGYADVTDRQHCGTEGQQQARRNLPDLRYISGHIHMWHVLGSALNTLNKSNVIPVYALKAQGEVKVELHSFLTTADDRGQWPHSCCCRSVYR